MLCSKMWSVFKNVPCLLENDLYSDYLGREKSMFIKPLSNSLLWLLKKNNFLSGFH